MAQRAIVGVARGIEGNGVKLRYQLRYYTTERDIFCAPH